ncbi:AMP-dependent synthetase/ligase [Psychrobacter phenylpyruvicus]|uniref:Long-chain-fatty-acid--CoA ligase FadD15 n=1 Tax=Psychrobacter phenylpyruvicus TaxID=29432 RepID=A0A379LKW4_9GAMM|nr:long-chain fatty acid--CoA ligase [Psychrobacter phenylpyruvicus]SUD90537.1 Long-chain-fatty-acid--CoA ligase FadD15 [Psychrobacter phenylpyruvicus]
MTIISPTLIYSFFPNKLQLLTPATAPTIMAPASLNKPTFSENALAQDDTVNSSLSSSIQAHTSTSSKVSSHTTISDCDTLVKLWRHVCKERGNQTAHREKSLGIWQSSSWSDYYNCARDIGMGLIDLGLNKGATVSILSEDNKEWLYCDLGICAVGGIPNGIYTTDSPEQLVYLVNDSCSEFLIVENDEQLHKYLQVRELMPSLKKIIVFDKKGLRDLDDDSVLFLEQLIELGQQATNAETRFEQLIDLSQPSDIRTLIYTSGTTGNPKGAIITHANSMYEIQATASVLDVYPSDEQLCFLPLCHILERVVSVDIPIHRGCIVNFAESTETVFDNLREVSPHTFTAVPRLWEKLYATVSNMRSDASSFNGWAFDNAVKVGKAYATVTLAGDTPSSALSIQYRFWDTLVLKKIRELLGMSNIRRAITGAAPISPEVILWFHAIGVRIYEGYGMTESTGVISVNSLGNIRLGSVGQLIPGSEAVIADNGEILIKGPHIFDGYWNNPEKTAEDLRDGWLHTGDMGEIKEGYLYITGRIKDIIITAGGKNITPAVIESKLKFSHYISDAVVIGDKRKYLTCLIMIDQENVEKFAQDNQVSFSDFSSLCHSPQVIDLIDQVIQDANQSFAQVEQIKYFRLIDVLLTAEDEELTATMKLKRSFVEKRHHALIDAMY